MRHITFWIGLDDSDEDNGCVHYVPGSHKWDLLPRTDLANDMEAVLSVLSEEQQKRFLAVPSTTRAGEASIHHPMMLHGSYENRSSRPRRAVVLNYIGDGVLSDSDEPLLTGIPVIPKGEPLNGQFFPLVS
jgi:ectoine hydroxylase-related dioxygenase (phytanoyl-CoA dioxygenase family)